MAFIENEFLPRNIKAGQLSGEIFRTSDNSCFVISRSPQKLRQTNYVHYENRIGRNERIKQNKMIEGERFMHLGQDILHQANRKSNQEKPDHLT